jgi:uncharacterized membrane protein YecN with MAPEG domain
MVNRGFRQGMVSQGLRVSFKCATSEAMLAQHALNIAGFYAALHVLIFIALSGWVVRERLARKIGLGDGGDVQFLQLVRMHGHTAEYLAPTLILMMFFAIMDVGALSVHLFGIASIAGRVLHIAGIHSSPHRSMGRALGMTLILGSLAVASLTIILFPLFHS